MHMMYTPSIYHVFIGLADGVGGWSQQGIDSSAFSWTLVKCIFDEGTVNSRLDPKSTLSMCVDKIQRKFTSLYGSSTAVVAKIHASRPTHTDSVSVVQFEGINLGDSGFAIFRKSLNSGPAENESWSVVLASKEQQHAFNCPFQVSPVPSMSDHPSNGDSYVFEARTGDIILVASDGLFDNISVGDVCKIFNECPEINSNNITDGALEELAGHLVATAIAYGLDARRCSPFCENARKAGYHYDGG